MKWGSAKQLRRLLLALAIITPAGHGAPPEGAPAAEATHMDSADSTLQLGLYDLLSRRTEIYNIRLKQVDGALFTTLTSPDASGFVLQGKFIETARLRGKHYYQYTPFAYHSAQRGLMIEGMADMLMARSYAVHIINQPPLVVGRSGIFVSAPVAQ